MPYHGRRIPCTGQLAKFPVLNTREVKVSLFTPNKGQYIGNLLTYDLGDGLVGFPRKNGSGILNSRFHRFPVSAWYLPSNFKNAEKTMFFEVWPLKGHTYFCLHLSCSIPDPVIDTWWKPDQDPFRHKVWRLVQVIDTIGVNAYLRDDVTFLCTQYANHVITDSYESVSSAAVIKLSQPACWTGSQSFG